MSRRRVAYHPALRLHPGPRRFAGRSTTNFLLPIACWRNRHCEVLVDEEVRQRAAGCFIVQRPKCCVLHTSLYHGFRADLAGVVPIQARPKADAGLPGYAADIAERERGIWRRRESSRFRRGQRPTPVCPAARPTNTSMTRPAFAGSEGPIRQGIMPVSEPPYRRRSALLSLLASNASTAVHV